MKKKKAARNEPCTYTATGGRPWGQLRKTSRKSSTED
jgi:hypothetical protein